MEDQKQQQLAAEAGAIEAVVAALQAHPQVAEVQEQGCRALRNVCFLAPTPQGAHASSAQQPRVRSRRWRRRCALTRSEEAGVQGQGCWALRNVCAGTDGAERAREQRAAAAGAIEAIVAALQAHPQEVEVQAEGCRALGNCAPAPTPRGTHAASAQQRRARSRRLWRRCRLTRRRRSCRKFTTKLPRTTLGTGLARTGTNTGTPREPPKRLLRGRRGT